MAARPDDAGGAASSFLSDPLGSDQSSGTGASSPDASADDAATPRDCATAGAAAAAAAAATRRVARKGSSTAGGAGGGGEDEEEMRDQASPAPAPAGEAVLTGRLDDNPAGVRIWCDGLTADSRQPWWDEAFALLTLSVFICWIHILLGLFVWGFFNRWALLAFAGICGTALLPAEPLLWERFLGNPVFRSWRRYFRFSVAYDVAIDLENHYVYAEMPHSVFPLSQIIATSLGADAWQGHKVYSIAADSVLSIPGWRHVFSWVGARPATHRNFRWLLKKGSVGLVPGGIAEMFMSEAPRADVVKLLDRKGFVRVAVEAGAPLVPIYHFGAWDLCRWAAPKSWESLSRKWRVSMGFIIGRCGLPLPHRVPLFMCVGTPIPVPQLSPSDPGFKDAVDEAHARLVDGTRRLFYKYRGLYPGYEGRDLKIV